MDKVVIEEFGQFQLARSLSVKTVQNRESILRSLSRTVEVPLLSVETRDLRRHLARTTVKPATKRIERVTFRTFYSFAQEEGYRDDNPAERIPPIKVPRNEPRPFTVEQIQAMLDSGAYRKTRAMILLGYYQGFRVSQISRVRGDDIDLLAGTIRTVAKGGKERHLPLHPVIADLSLAMPQGWWFPARNGEDKPVLPASVTELITEAKKRAGITDPTLTPHSLRHSFATDLVENEVDIRVVQELLLHDSLATTQIYAQVSRRRKEAAIQTLHGLDVPAQSGRVRLKGAA